MKLRHLRLQPSTIAFAGVVASIGLAFNPALGSVIIDESGHGIGANTMVVEHDVVAKYIVRFEELPLALYNGGLPGLDGIPRTSEPGRRQHAATQSAQANAYVNYLSSQQSQHLADVSTAVGRTVTAEHQMRFALNAAVLTLTGDEAQKIAKIKGIVGVERDQYRQLTTDLGPGFIGAASIWWGTPAGQDTLFAAGFDSTQPYRGEGMVVADIDTGYNSNSPSFAGVDDSGFTFVNPLGQGNYLGLCNPSSPNQPTPTLYAVAFAGCNNKVIGAYDFINTVAPFSVEDYQGHGSHTGSTAAGNTRDGTIGAYNARISGVAPHANVVIYYACSAAGCPNSATAGAVDQAVQDSVVDSLNFSISGGTSPWSDSTSLAFLSAADSGIFVAAAGGNTTASVPNQLPGTVNHMEPWVTTVAAANHSGGPLGYFLTVSGAGAPAPIGMNTAPGSTQPSAAIAVSGLVVSPDFAAANDCVAKPAGTFAGKLAIMHFVSGPCGTNTLAARAKAAGAVQVLLVNSANDYINSGATQTIPVFTTTSAQGNALVAFISANTSATANVSYPANTRLPVIADSLASFSLLGPATFDVIKPDVQAPGVSILAAVNNANPPVGTNPPVQSGANVLALYSGTSMATPHTTGSAALLLGLHPDWTPLEVKSALMMTAKEAGLTKADHATPSDFYDRGAGRIQDDAAAAAGLVLNETGLNFMNANPANGGDPKTLNIASMQNRNCVTATSPTASTPSCKFLRKFRSTQDHTVTWTATLTGVSGTLVPASFPVVAHAKVAVNITVDASSYASDGIAHFGELVLTPSDASLAPLHLPIAVGLQPPTISAAPSPLAISIANGFTNATTSLTVSNTGGPSLVVTSTNDSVSTGVGVVIDQPSQGNYGFYSNYWADQNHGAYPADDFLVTIPGTNLSKLSFPGFVLAGGALATLGGQNINFEIYSDNAGVPNGNPDTATPGYVWHYVATIGTTTGLNVAGNTIAIDLNAAGAPATNLASGKYWMVVYLSTPAIGSVAQANGWLWFESTLAHGYDAQNIDPGHIFGGSGNWTNNTTTGDFRSMSMHIEQIGPCGATWLGTSPSTLTLGGLTSGAVTVSVDSTKFPVGQSTATAFLCIDSNDATHPVYVVPVTATQN